MMARVPNNSHKNAVAKQIHNMMNTYEGIEGCIVKHYVCTKKEDKILVYDTRDGTKREILEDVECMCPCGDFLFYFVWPNTAQMRDLETGAVVGQTFKYFDAYSDEGAPPTVDKCISSGMHVVGISSYTSVYMCNVDFTQTKETHARALSNRKVVTDASFHPKKNELVVACTEELCIWSKPFRPPGAPPAKWRLTMIVTTGMDFMSLAHSPCGKYLAIGGLGCSSVSDSLGFEENIRVWSTTKYIEDSVFPTDSPIVGMAFSPCSTFILAGDTELEYREWNWKEGSLLFKPRIPNRQIQSPYTSTHIHYVGTGALITSTEKSHHILAYYEQHANAEYAYILELLDKQQWWPAVISGVILSYLTLTLKL